MKKISVFIITITSLILILLVILLKTNVNLTEITENFAIKLPKNLIKITGNEKELQDILSNFIDESDKVSYLGILPQNKDENSYKNSTLLIFEQMPKEVATSGVVNIGKYTDTLAFAQELDMWYKDLDLDLDNTEILVIDVIKSQGGAPVFILHAKNQNGVALIAETYSTNYSDTVIACFTDENIKAVEPTQSQYDEFISMLKTITVK